MKPHSSTPPHQFSAGTSTFNPDNGDPVHNRIQFHHPSSVIENTDRRKRQKLENRDNFLPQSVEHLTGSQDLSQNPYLQALNQQHQQRQLPSYPQMQHGTIPTHQHPQQQRPMQQNTNLRQPFRSGALARRFMQYMCHQKCRPQHNSIHYWRKLVGEYFDPRAKTKLCLSSYGNVGNHASGILPPAAVDTWHCDLCGSKLGKGFVAYADILPRLNQIKFDSGIIDEHLRLDKPHEIQLPSGIMILEYKNVVQESVYEKLHVIHKGRLRILFSVDLKILNWQFCAQGHEVYVPSKCLVPQVGCLMQVAQNCPTSVTKRRSSGVSRQALQENCNMFMTASYQLHKILDSQSFNEWGYPKRYVRFSQIYEVTNLMKDLIDFSIEQQISPLESFKIYAHEAKLQRKRMEMARLFSSRGSAIMAQNMNRVATVHPHMSSHITDIPTGTPASLNDYGNTSEYLARTNQKFLASRPINDFSSPQIPRMQSPEERKHDQVIQLLMKELSDEQERMRQQVNLLQSNAMEAGASSPSISDDSVDSKHQPNDTR